MGVTESGVSQNITPSDLGGLRSESEGISGIGSFWAWTFDGLGVRTGSLRLWDLRIEVSGSEAL